MPVLEFGTLEALREIKSGIELIRDKYLPVERLAGGALGGEELSIRRENTNCMIEHLHQKVLTLLEEDCKTIPPAGSAIRLPQAIPDSSSERA